MTKDELYFLLAVCMAFSVFGIALATSYVQYRRWLKRQPKPE